MKKEPVEAREGNKWRWDAVTSTFVALIVAVVLMALLAAWPHNEEEQMKEHLKSHAAQE